jgi:hypothetical protein
MYNCTVSLDLQQGTEEIYKGHIRLSVVGEMNESASHSQKIEIDGQKCL